MANCFKLLLIITFQFRWNIRQLSDTRTFAHLINILQDTRVVWIYMIQSFCIKQVKVCQTEKNTWSVLLFLETTCIQQFMAHTLIQQIACIAIIRFWIIITATFMEVNFLRITLFFGVLPNNTRISDIHVKAWFAILIHIGYIILIQFIFCVSVI